MNRNPSYRPARRSVSFKRKLPVKSYVLRKKNKRNVITQSQQTDASTAIVESNITRYPFLAGSVKSRRAELGVSIGAKPTRQSGRITWTTVNASSKTLYMGEITYLAGRSTTEMYLRQGNIIDVHGIKLNLDLKNRYNAPIWIEYGIVCPANNVLTDGTDFLVAEGDADTGLSIVSTHDSIRYKSTRINNLKHKVLLHRRVPLIHQPDTTGGHTDGTWNTKEGRAWGEFQHYVPVNRRIAYENATATTCTSKLFFVVWAYGFAEPGGASVTTNLFDYNTQAIMYFNDAP